MQKGTTRYLESTKMHTFGYWERSSDKEEKCDRNYLTFLRELRDICTFKVWVEISGKEAQDKSS